MNETRVPVLVVGAGLAGLSAAMFLANQGIPALVVEKHPGTSIHPRASGQTARTMELLRTAGVDEDVLAASYGTARGLTIQIGESLRGRIFQTIMSGKQDWNTSSLSPRPWGMATQDMVEPIMLRRARELGARVEFETELVSLEQDADGVRARLLDLPTGRIRDVRADYLVAADGHRSPVRERLGIPRQGLGTLTHYVGVIFTGDLAGIVEPGDARLLYLQNEVFSGALGINDEHHRHVLAVEYHPERGESLRDYPEERIRELIGIALDAPDFVPDVLGVQTWEIAALVAQRFRDGRVFLAGDAAKVTPPTGGMGGNTAVMDGYDIAWKLAAVLHGHAGPGLLDSYEPERKPFAELVVGASLRNAVDRMAPEQRARLEAHPLPELNPMDLLFGYHCRSGAVLTEDPADDALAESAVQPTGRPGYRAPHVPLERDSVELSTVDLFGDGWVLLTGPAGDAWHAAAKAVADELGVPLRAVGPGPDLLDRTGQLTARYGITDGGASLVRPDGYVAWRSPDTPADPTAALRTALRAVLSR